MNIPARLKQKKFFHWSLYSVLVGLLAGFVTALFIYALDFVTLIHKTYAWLIWLLPVAGLFTGIAYLKYGEEAEKGTGLILDEIHNPKKILPVAMAPLVFLCTLFSHFAGASVGREGTAVQMGATVADQVNKFFSVEADERKILIVAGTGAAFSAALGTPLAGALFGLEIIQIGRLRYFALFECLLASFVAYYTIRYLGVEHTYFPKLREITLSSHLLTTLVISGLIFGLVANVFIQLTHLVEAFFQKYVRTKWLFPFVGGIVLLFLFSFDGAYQFRGLGLINIQNAFLETSLWTQPFFKLVFTVLSVGSGFKGGEFIPLVFIGSTTGSFLSGLFAVSRPLMAALGFAAVFGAAANAPIACAIMAAELFGWTIFPYAFVCCWVAYYLSGHVGIYKNQKLEHSKKDQLLKVFRWPHKLMKKWLK